MAHRYFTLEEKERRAFKQAESRARKASELKRLQAVRM
jgi:hypothetical protein